MASCFNYQENLDVAIDFNSSNISAPSAASSEVSTDANNTTVPAEHPRKYAYVSGWTVSDSNVIPEVNGSWVDGLF